MNRLQAELQRLFPPAPDPQTLRVLVVELLLPAPGTALAALWTGVQRDLNLPAPALAVNGRDAMQVWFALDEPVPRDVAARFLDDLRRRYLAEQPVHGVHAEPALPDAPAGRPPRPAPHYPVQPQPAGRWSAFIAPDLAPLFADTPWLDLPPGDDAQAALLARLSPTPARDLLAAAARLRAAAVPQAAPLDASAAARDFLLTVMQDGNAPLGLRIEAAKALLPTVRPG